MMLDKLRLRVLLCELGALRKAHQSHMTHGGRRAVQPHDVPPLADRHHGVLIF